MTTRKEERERLRQERLAQQQAASSSERRRLMLGYAVAGVLVAAIVVGLVIAITGGGDDGDTPSASDFPELAYINPDIGQVPDGVAFDGRDGTDPPPQGTGDLEQAARAANCELQLDLPNEGNNHFQDEDRGSYETSPPTSGDHYGVPGEVAAGALSDGAFLETPPLGRVVHSLEHGRVAIHYSPDLSEEEQLEIKGVFEESPQGMILLPNPDMPYAVAIAAWTNMAGCEEYQGAATLDVLRTFRDIYRGQGPEFFPL